MNKLTFALAALAALAACGGSVVSEGTGASTSGTATTGAGASSSGTTGAGGSTSTSTSVTGAASSSSSATTSSSSGGTCEPACGYMLTCCGDTCAELDNDPFNCGTCGVVCPGPTPYCHKGACATACTGTQPCPSADFCCGDQCCGAGNLCCDDNGGGPVQVNPHCSTPENGTCPHSCFACL